MCRGPHRQDRQQAEEQAGAGDDPQALSHGTDLRRASLISCPARLAAGLGCARRATGDGGVAALELQLNPDQELFRDTTRRFLEESCPITEVRRLADTTDGFERDWWRRGAELGWTSMLVPESQGGGSISGNGLRDLALVAEEMGRMVSPGPF